MYRWFVDSFPRVPGLFLLFPCRVSLDPVRSYCCFFFLAPKRLCCWGGMHAAVCCCECGFQWCGLSIVFAVSLFPLSFSRIHFFSRLLPRVARMPLIYLFAFVCLNEQYGSVFSSNPRECPFLSLFLCCSLLSLLCFSSVHRPVTGVHLLRPILLP